MKRAHSRGFAEAADFRVVFSANRIAPAAGFILSDLLDPLIHGDRGVDVAFSDLSEDERAGLPVLTAFHVQSVVEYLDSQKFVRCEIERALEKHRKAWHLENLGSGRAVWKKVCISCVLFEMPSITGRQGDLRRSPSVAPSNDLIRPKKTVRGSKFSVLLAVRDPHDFAARPWKDGHQRFGVFEGGKFIELLIEG